MIELKYLAEDGYMCVGERDISKLKGGEIMTVHHDIIGSLGPAEIVEIAVGEDDESKTHYLADVSTGTLYDPETLRCMSSDYLYLVPK